MSAKAPGASQPSASPNPSTAALPAVAIPSTSSVPSHRAGSCSRTRETNEAMRIAPNMFWLSEQLLPSVPIPTLTPASRISRAAAMPDPRRRLLPGLWAMDAPRSAILRMSSGSSHTLWAPVKLGPRNPSASRCAVSVRPYLRMPATAWILDSARCICRPTPYSAARSRHRTMNSSEQCRGTVGASAGRTRSRSTLHSWRISRQAESVASMGARRLFPAAARKGSGSASSRPGIAW